jgi:hypothetical protein
VYPLCFQGYADGLRSYSLELRFDEKGVLQQYVLRGDKNVVTPLPIAQGVYPNPRTILEEKSLKTPTTKRSE